MPTRLLSTSEYVEGKKRRGGDELEGEEDPYILIHLELALSLQRYLNTLPLRDPCEALIEFEAAQALLILPIVARRI